MRIRMHIGPGVSPLQAGIQLRATTQHRITNPDKIYFPNDPQRILSNSSY